ncbi:hypothetical protein AvCA_41220 [Azotobacter vinelandii CA]|uniref:DUF1302 domain-containing protein n=2 Tax=Azotobacter vinelandii TaxID=354 RepID=C1DES6_AZOVD|nr:DUF1302 domain-containing protein [Azotobacter vinelandii]ACO80255.1 conserved hypothetical protein [Azotobacter vinelandii DJ]AGK16053.1 hypothetical protein AvCA_41220 [Azotobacter vinelandii CA]AGK21803.1 hypothetical protein AvCA6_41220 [Azotobacter vinelandii CA6]SFX72224.1 Protein of unknown function [Azotobacter vinelandii]GLK61786.1 hypothetical protein GCM10017624_39500 [Azotobacter vinelandii]
MSSLSVLRCLAAACVVSLAMPAGAVSFNIGSIEGQLDSSLSLEAAWSTARTDKDLIGASGGRALSPISDDGRRNFKRGETFAKRLRGVHGLEFKRGDDGLFLRGDYWYDFELKDERRPFRDIDDSNRKEGVRASGARLLDAFVYRNYLVGELPGSLRLGRQVVNWGEGLFLQGGIDAINPLDARTFRRPVAEVRDGRLPVALLHLAQSLNAAFTLEAFYQLAWDQSLSDNCGTFFSQADMLADGCDRNLAVLGRASTLSAAEIAALEAEGVAWTSPDEGVLVRRGGDRDARDAGQWGIALRYFAESLDTEFSAYFMNYHSRAAIFSTVAAGPAAFAANLPAGLRPLAAAGNARYFAEYPEDIRLFGLGFATTLAMGTRWRGELSYRPNAPVQLNINDLLGATLTPLDSDAALLQATAGQDIHGYRRKEIIQVQTGFSQELDAAMGASRLTLEGEVGWTHVGGLEGTSELRYGRDPLFGAGPLPDGACQAQNAALLAGRSQKNLARHCESDGFTTRDSWGYRLRATWAYRDVLPGLDLEPGIAWSHDVDGYSPGPDGNFVEGRKALGLSLDAVYLDTYSAGLSYTDFFGGEYSTLADRDFLLLSLGVRF